jgi:hypothetical protein
MMTSPTTTDPIMEGPLVGTKAECVILDDPLQGAEIDQEKLLELHDAFVAAADRLRYLAVVQTATCGDVEAYDAARKAYMDELNDEGPDAEEPEVPEPTEEEADGSSND